jgi:hypothetical protein
MGKIKLILSALLLLYSSISASEVLRFEYSGVISAVDFSTSDPFSRSVSVGTTFRGFYEFDSVTPPPSGTACLIMSQCRWDYPIPPYSFGITLGNTTIDVPNSYTIINTNDLSGSGDDSYAVSSGSGSFNIGDWSAALQLTFKDDTGTFISNPQDILIEPPDLTVLSLAEMGIVRTLNGCSGCDGSLFGTITNIVAVDTPTPSPTLYPNRDMFLGAVGPSITDDYTGYAPTPSTPVNLTNEEMTAVLGETSYESFSASNLNSVGNVFVNGDGTNYCAGCNGNFKLTFDNTSLTFGSGVYGVGVDIVLHTSRRCSIGDVCQGDPVADGTVLVEFTDGTIEELIIPADIGFFGPETYFLGVTDDRGIKSLSVGTAPFPERHRWVIDNLTIASLSTANVSIDIKPGSDPNPVNPKSKGVIPVAVLGSIDFDATQIDFSTVKFGLAEAPPAHDGHVEDVNDDGFMDMMFHFKVQATGIVCGETEATLTGATFGGIQFNGTDAVKTVGCN